MTLEITLVLATVAAAVILFVTERLRMDLVALLVLAGLTLMGLVTPEEGLSGFSNAAVVTVWAVFVLSGGLARTGVANVIGRQVLRVAGSGELRLVVVIMLTAGIMSAFMNNVGVAALLLPVVMDIARRTERPPAKLLMPLAFGSLMGGLMTLIGTPPNILISDALREAGLPAFRLFDYAPVGIVIMLTGTAFMSVVGRYLLPVRDLGIVPEHDLSQVYELRERLWVLGVPHDSELAGKTLAESRLGTALNLNVIGILRDGETRLAPGPDTVLRPGDRLLAEGRLERLSALRGRRHLVMEEGSLDVERLMGSEVDLLRVALSPDSPLVGKTLIEIDFQRKYNALVVAMWRDGSPTWRGFDNVRLRPGDVLLVEVDRVSTDALRSTPDFVVSEADEAQIYQLHERLMVVRVPEDSALVSKTLAESRLYDIFGVTVLGIVRPGETELLTSANEPLAAGDVLLAKGNPEDLYRLRALQELQVDEAEFGRQQLESEHVGMMEVVLSPHTTLAGRTLRDLHFRDKYGLHVLAIWRQGRAYRSQLRDMPLQFGDALLLYGPREKLMLLGSEPDFLVLTQAAQEPPRLDKAPLAALIMAGVLLPVILGWIPISIAAVSGAALMVLTGCLTMDEAYRFIEWRAVFLIAGMLPLGIAMEQTGTAQFVAEGVVSAVGRFGPLAMLAGLYILTTLATQVMPNAAVAVLLAPIALSTAADLGMSPFALMMVVAVAASASFLSPVAHPANVLIMGPGGYRFSDYIRVGLPLTVLMLLVVLVVLPVFWPLV